ncbi:MAG: hypothetical protein MJ133_07320 [Lachnospiraceae bacterium]|nr:hypothetical protein [Lachnospiraceae bacterium]
MDNNFNNNYNNNMQQNGVSYNRPMNNMPVNNMGYSANQYNQAPPSTGILVMGILGLALCELFGIGLIFSIIGLVKSSNYAKVAPLTGKAKVGRILSIVGIPVNAFLIFYFIVVVGIIAAYV